MNPARRAAAWASLLAFGIAGCDGMMGSKPAAAPPPTQVEHNRELVSKMIGEGMNGKTPAAMNAFTQTMSPGVVNHNPMAGKGRDGTIQMIAGIGQSFPDSKATVLDLFATEDRVVVRWNFKGTLTGQPFLGIAPAGQKVDFDIIDIWTVKDGQLYEHWDELDWTRALVQLGATTLPAPFVAMAQQPPNR